MNAILPNNKQIKNHTVRSDLALLLLIFLSVSFFNVAAANDAPFQEKAIFFADVESLSDRTSEFDSDDHEANINNQFTIDFDVALYTLALQFDPSNHLNYCYLRPLTRAPPKNFI